MKIKLPIIEERWDDETNQKVSSTSLIDVRINNSVLAHLKWEQQFEETEGIDLLTAIERVQGKITSKLTERDMLQHFTIMLRILYCFIDSEDMPSFPEFAVLLGDNPVPIMEKLKIVLTENAKVSAKN